MALERVGSTSPIVCQGTTANGPCDYKREDGSQFCSLHGGGQSARRTEAVQLRSLKLNGQYAQRAGEMSSGGGVKSLCDEIYLMKVALETIFNSIKCESEMLLYVDKLEKLSKTIGGLVDTFHKLQERSKELLGRDVVMDIFDRLLEKICERVTDPDIIAALADDGAAIIKKAIGV